MVLTEYTRKPRAAMLHLHALLDIDHEPHGSNPAPLMKIVQAQYRPPSKGTALRLSLFNLAATTLAVSCTFFAFGCSDRSPTSKEPAASPPPVTTAPVPAPPSSAAAALGTEKSSEPAAPTGRVAEDASTVREPDDTRSDRVNDEEISTPPASEAARVSPAVTSSDNAHPQPPSSATDEEDVSAALRREVAELERQRARQQPRGW